MRLHVLQHVAFEGPANIAGWAERRGISVLATRLFAGDPFPSLDDFELLAILGGPMGVGDVLAYPWLAAEKRFLERVLGAGKHAVGVCLGSRLLAEALGAQVYGNVNKEIGWYPVRRAGGAERSRFSAVLPPEFDAFHWHADAFDLPPGALHLLSSDCTGIQAFECGKALGLLCHLEVTPESAAAMIRHCAGDIDGGPFTQTPAEILAAKPARYAALEPILAALLDRLVD